MTRAGRFRTDKWRGPPRSRHPALDWPAAGHAERASEIGGDMDKPADGRGSTGSTDGIKAKGDAGNKRHACKANPAIIDDVGKKHGMKDIPENFSGEKFALAPKAATKFL